MSSFDFLILIFIVYVFRIIQPKLLHQYISKKHSYSWVV